MDKTINISIRDKLAKNLSHVDYVCGNTDYMVHFDFDAEWDAYPIKTARFIEVSGAHQDVVVDGGNCAFPRFDSTIRIEVGVFAGDLHTTTPAVVSARRSILSSGGDRPATPEKEPYDQMMEIINADALRAETAANEAEASAKRAEEAYLNELFIVRTSAANRADKTAAEIRAAVAENKVCLLLNAEGMVYQYRGEEKPQFTGETDATVPTFYRGVTNNTSGIQIYTAQFASADDRVRYMNVASAKTPNPYKLLFKGAVEKAYDGSGQVTVEIPEGGGGSGLPEGEAPHQMLVTDSEGVAKWEDRTHYKEIVECLPETVVTGEGDEWPLLTPFTNIPSVGDACTVTWNGVEYTSMAVPFDMDGVTCPIIGNAGQFGFEDNGQPFLIMAIPEEMIETSGIYGLVGPLDGTTGSVTISVKKTFIKQIPDEYVNHPKELVIISIEPTDTADRYTTSVTFDEITAGLMAGKTFAFEYTHTVDEAERTVFIPISIKFNEFQYVFETYAAGYTYTVAVTVGPYGNTIAEFSVTHGMLVINSEGSRSYAISVNENGEPVFGSVGTELKVLATEEYVQNAPKSIIYLGDVSGGATDEGISLYTAKAYADEELSEQITALSDIRAMFMAGALLSIESEGLRGYMYPTSFFEGDGNMYAITTIATGVATYLIDCTEESDDTDTTTSTAGLAVAGQAIAGR